VTPVDVTKGGTPEEEETVCKFVILAKNLAKKIIF